MGPSRIERYVLSRNLWAVGATLAIVAWVVVLLEFVEVSRNVGGDGGFGASMALALFKSPTTILTLLPFCFLFGGVAAFVGLNRSSELIAMRASGVSAWRFIFPTAIAAFLIGLWSVTVAGPMAAGLNARYQSGSAVLSGGSAAAAPKEQWLRQEDDRSVIYIEAKTSAKTPDAVVLNTVTMLVYAKQLDGGLDFSRQILADKAELRGGAWRLTNATETTPGASGMHSDSLSIPSDLDENATLERFTSPEAVGFWRLPATIAETERVGLSATPYRLRLQQLLATPLLFSAMTVLAAAFSLRLMRLGNLGLMAAGGVAIGFGVFFLAQLCGALGKADALSPALAAWAPPLAALLVGFTLLCYTEDG